MLPVSNDTLLRVVRRRSRRPSDPLKVVGIDDWAWRRDHFVPEPETSLRRICPAFVEDRDGLIAACSRCVVARDGRDCCTGDDDLVAGDLGVGAQQRRTFDDASDHLKDAANRLLIVIGTTDRLAVATAVQHDHRDRDDGGERSLA